MLLTNGSSGPFLLVGDFNLPDTRWTDTDDNTFDSASLPILNLAQLFQLQQFNGIRNDRGVLLDLVFSSLEHVKVTQALDPMVTVESHHPSLDIEIRCPGSARSRNITYKLDFNKSNKQEIFNHLQNWEYPLLSCVEDMESSFTSFCSNLSSLIKSFTPLKCLGKSTFPCWFSQDLKRLVLEKKLLHRDYKRTSNLQTYRSFCRVRTQCKELTEICYRSYINRVEDSMQGNIKAFWGHIKNTKKISKTVSSMYLNEKHADTPQHICSLFAEHFSSVFKPPLTTPSYDDSITNLLLTGFSVSCEEVEAVLSSLDANKGAGPDEIPPSLLKYCSCILAPHITIFFNSFLSSGIFPSCLKTSFVTPIFKNGNPSDIKNYRPIAIQPTLAKVFESLVLTRMSFFAKSYVSTAQHGFYSGRSATTNLLTYHDDIISAFNRNHEVDSVYIDFSKAFDRISHEHLLAKLGILGVAGPLLKWFRSYISGRCLIVRYNGSESDAFPVLSGVPQGSLLGPVLFSIFINDLVLAVKHSRVLLFADDAKVYKEVTMDIDCEKLQSDLDSVLRWCSENEMELNVSKCAILSFSRRTSVTVFNYTLLGSTLHRSSTMRDLGVTVSSDLSPELHLSNIIKKANSALGFIVRISRDGFSPHALKTLYVQLVRPLLEYCSPVWSPYQIGHIDLLEGVQRKFLRVLGVNLGFRYLEVPLDELRRQFGLLPLSSRRNILDLLLLKKIVTASVDSPDLLSRVDFRCARVVVRSRDLFERVYCSTQYSYHSALPRLHRLGNSLPHNIDLFQCSENHLKKELTNLYSLEEHVYA